MPATVTEVVDGDTMHLILDLGWRIYFHARCRIAGINAPEMNTEAGRLARAYAAKLLPEGALVTFTSHCLDKYGRPLGAITDRDGRDFAAEMKAAGHALAVKS